MCLSVWNTFVIGGFANGQLRLYDSETGVKVVEVTAHARPVMALDVALNAGMVRNKAGLWGVRGGLGCEGALDEVGPCG